MKLPTFFKEKNIEDPVFIVSYMRSGSNLIANVLCQSFKRRFASIYDPEITPMCDRQPYYILKSHAPSYSHLLSECGAFVPCYNRFPHKIITLIRDPRDVFISQYDWYVSRFNETIDQATFLDDMKYCYSATGMGALPPRETFRSFASNWWEVSEFSSVKSVCRIKYEDLISDKKLHFDKLKKFLGLKGTLREDLFEKRVKQAASGREQRGVCRTHEIYADKYSVLIRIVEEAFGDIIEKFGYA